MLIKFAAWLSTLFVFCRNNLHLLLFSSRLPPSKNISQITFTLSSFPIPENVFHLEDCQFVMNRGFSVDPSDGKNYELLADISSDLGTLWGKLCDGSSSRDSKESIHFTPNSPFCAGRPRSDARIRFPNLNAFSVCTSQTVILWLEETFSPRLGCGEGRIIVLSAWLTRRQLLKNGEMFV